MRASSKFPAPCLGALACLMFTGGVAHGQLSATQRDDVGFTALQTRLGASMPTGEGISVSQVEADEDGGTALRYRPDASQFSGKQFVFESGLGDGTSNHATTVGKYFYGPDSLSPDIGKSPAEQISVYSAGDFLGSGFLRNGNSSALPDVESNDVQNHSWVGDYEDVAANTEAIRRIDYAIQQDDFVATFGLNNGGTTSVPPLMAGAYNGITVGRSDGRHSSGGTTLDGGFRTRPDIVVPATFTSWAAPTVGGAASLLIETARSTTGLGNGDRSFVVKSLLMTGATRDEPEFGGTWSNSSTDPLDPIYGAGELNLDRSHGILESGEHPASDSQVVGSAGWDLGLSSADTTSQLYFFDLVGDNMLFEIAASLVWNREINPQDTQNGQQVNYSFNSFLANLDLRLFSASGFVLGEQISESVSTTQNVELIAVNGLAPGRYAWEVTSDTNSTEYGISWFEEGSTVIPEPSVACLALLGMLPLLRRRR